MDIWPPYSEDVPAGACLDPGFLPMIDAAFERPGGPESKWIKEHLCAYCPLRSQCLERAMTHGEAGVWGGTTPKTRSNRGAPNYRMVS
jgi:hypothetical protein